MTTERGSAFAFQSAISWYCMLRVFVWVRICLQVFGNRFAECNYSQEENPTESENVKGGVQVNNVPSGSCQKLCMQSFTKHDAVYDY